MLFGTAGFCLTICLHTETNTTPCAGTNHTGESMQHKKATLAEAFQGFRLVVRNYQQRGYLPRQKTLKGVFVLFARLLVWLYEILQFKVTGNGCVFVAKDEKKVVGTITIYFNPKNIPLFNEEYRGIKAQSSKIAYLGSLATADSCRCTMTSIQMMGVVKKFLEESRIRTMVWIVHPNHAEFYRKYFQRSGYKFFPEAHGSMPGLDNAPAVLIAVQKESPQ